MKYKIIVLIALIVFILAIGSAKTISVSEIDYISNSSFYSEDTILIEFLVSESTENVQYTLEPEEVDPHIEGELSQEVKLNVENQDIWAEYNIDNRDLRKIQEVKFTREIFDKQNNAIEWAENNCLDLKRNGIPDYNYYNNYNFFPPFKTTIVDCGVTDHNSPVYNVGYLQNPPNTVFETEWVLNSKNKSIKSANLSNKNSGEGSSVRLGDHAHIEWQSLEGTGQSPPNPENTLAAYSSQTGWKLINEEKYNAYSNYLQNKGPKIIDKMSKKDQLEIKAFLEVKNTENSQKYIDASSEYYHSPLYKDNFRIEGNWEENIFRYSSEENMGWPKFLIYLDSTEYLSVEKELGSPSIISKIQQTNVSQMYGGMLQVDVTNEANSSGRFEGRITDCTEKFVGRGVNIQKKIEGGETKTFNPKISFNGTEEYHGECTFAVEDTNSGKEDTIKFQVKGKTQEECNPGVKFIRTDFREINGEKEAVEIIYECDKNGQSLLELEVCNSEQIAKLEENQHKCAEIDNRSLNSNSNECKIINFSTSNIFSGKNTGELLDLSCLVRELYSNSLSYLKNYVLLIGSVVLGVVGIRKISSTSIQA